MQWIYSTALTSKQAGHASAVALRARRLWLAGFGQQIMACSINNAYMVQATNKPMQVAWCMSVPRRGLISNRVLSNLQPHKCPCSSAAPMPMLTLAASLELPKGAVDTLQQPMQNPAQHDQGALCATVCSQVQMVRMLMTSSAGKPPKSCSKCSQQPTALLGKKLRNAQGKHTKRQSTASLVLLYNNSKVNLAASTWPTQPLPPLVLVEIAFSTWMPSS